MQTRFIFFGLILAFALGCVKDEIEDPAIDHTVEYFPLNLGHYVVYAMDSIVLDDAPGGNIKDTVTFQIKEEVTSFQIDLTGDTLYYIHRFRRNDSLDQWKLIDLWTASRSSFEAVKTEENLKFRKMAFPLHDGKKWTATSYIPAATTIVVGTEMMQVYQDWSSEVMDIDVPDQIGNFSFGSGQVMHILQTDTDDGGTKRYLMEKYVRNIGLVSRTDTMLDSRCLSLGDFTECLGKPWLDHAGKGYLLSQVMIDHN